MHRRVSSTNWCTKNSPSAGRCSAHRPRSRAPDRRQVRLHQAHPRVPNFRVTVTIRSALSLARSSPALVARSPALSQGLCPAGTGIPPQPSGPTQSSGRRLLSLTTSLGSRGLERLERRSTSTRGTKAGERGARFGAPRYTGSRTQSLHRIRAGAGCGDWLHRYPRTLREDLRSSPRAFLGMPEAYSFPPPATIASARPAVNAGPNLSGFRRLETEQVMNLLQAA